MAVAFVLMNTAPESLEGVLRALKTVDGVVEVYSVYGVFDIVAKVEVQDTERLRDIISWKIRKLQNVQSTETIVVM